MAATFPKATANVTNLATFCAATALICSINTVLSG